MRVVMITLDQIIDRRIIHQATTLVKRGYELIIIARSTSDLNIFETHDSIKIERVTDSQIKQANKCIFSLIAMFSYLMNLLCSILCIPLKYIFTSNTFNKLTNGINTINFFLNKLIRYERLFYLYTLRHQFSDSFFIKRLTFYRPNIIHVHDLPLLSAATRYKNKHNVPLVYDMHEYYPEQPRLTKLAKFILQRIEKHHIRYVDLVFTVNEMLADVISADYLGIDIKAIQNSADLQQDIKQGDFNRFRDEAYATGEQIIILYQGYIAEQRNLETIIEGMKLVGHDRFVLLIMGYGEYAKNLEQLISANNCADYVKLVPAKGQDELLSYTASADIGLIPYPYGQDINTTYVSPNKLYEFIAVELPILANELPFVSKILSENNFGYVHNMSTPEQFCEAIKSFPIDQVTQYKAELASNKHKFLWQHEQHKLNQLYDELITQYNLSGGEICAA